jgi:hypothetical protein
MRATRIQAHSDGQLTSNVWAMLQTTHLKLSPATVRLTKKGNRLQARLARQTAKSTHPKLVRKARMNGFIWIDRVESPIAGNQMPEKKERIKRAKSPLVFRENKSFEAFMATQNSVRNLANNL